MTIKLTDYLSPAENNVTLALRRAFSALSDGDTLELGGGVYDLFPDGAEVRNYFISNNDAGEKPIAFPIVGRTGITIDGGGADLIFHGRILPFAVDSSSDITIKNLSIDYSSVRYSQAEIIDADRYKTVLKFPDDSSCTVRNGNFCFPSEEGEEIFERVFALEYQRDEVTGAAFPSPFKPPYFPYTGEKKDHGFLGGMYRDVSLEEASPNVIKMHGNLGFVHTVGNYLIMTHATREFPGIFITDAKNVKIESVRIYYASAMGVIVQLSENVSLDHVVAEPRPGSGRLLSLNADATHFVNCRGKLSMTNCKFVSMNDDACNIHGIYALCKRLEAPERLICGFGHFQQRGINLCRPGDHVALIDRDTSETICTRYVVSSRLISPDELEIVLDSGITLGGHYLIENLSTAPEVYIADCESGNNRPRGFLLSSGGKTLVERCRFYNMNCGIQIGGEMRNWYESGAVSDVTIRDCDFTNSAYAGGMAIDISPKLYDENPRDFFHGRIIIENNRFVQSSRRIMRANLTRELIFKGNSFMLDESLPYHAPNCKTGVNVTNCGKIDVEDVKEEF